MILDDSSIHNKIQKAISDANERIMTTSKIYEDALHYYQFGELDIARIMFERVFTLDPTHGEAAHMLGIIYLSINDLKNAVIHLNEALKLNPNNLEAQSNLGVAFHRAGNYEVAAQIQRQVIKLNPEFINAHNNLGIALLELGNLVEAEKSLSKAVELQPFHPEAHNNLGNIYNKLKDFKKAEEFYKKSIEQNPNEFRTWLNYGHLLVDSMRLEEALEKYEKCCELNPENVESRFNLSFLYLLNGDFEKGWEQYEFRSSWLKSKGLSEITFDKPKWNGESLEGKTIFITPEQGYGDMVMFSRYLTRVSESGAKIILGTGKKLGSFLSTSFPNIEILEEGESTQTQFDYWIPIMSLPKIYRTDLSNIPEQKFKNDPKKVQEWKDKIGKSDKKRIGLCWKGTPTHRFNSLRSISLESILKALPDNFEYVSLQNEVTNEEKSLLTCYDIKDFADLGALCELVDLVITVDTAVAHVSGSLGQPTWTLIPYLPDWRWLKEGNSTPWYPSMKLYRQDKGYNETVYMPGDWTPVLKRINDDLKTF